MEPQKKENKEIVMEDVVEKKPWITPEIQEFDVIEVTKAGGSILSSDAFSGYS